MTLSTNKTQHRRAIKRLFTFYLIGGFFAMTSNAYAYIDPGSGSVIVTTILGLFAAVAYTFRKVFYNLRSKIFGKKDDEDDRSLDD